MPTYDYRCERSGEMFEVRQSFSDDALTTCPQSHGGEGSDTLCGAPVKKVFSKVGIAFKGDGFYKNDHGSGSSGRKKEASESSDSNGSSSNGSSSSSDGSSSSSDGASSSGSSDSGSTSSAKPSKSSSSKDSSSKSSSSKDSSSKDSS